MTRPEFMPWARTYLIRDIPSDTTGDRVMTQYNNQQRDLSIQQRILQRKQNVPNNVKQQQHEIDDHQ